MRGLPLGFLILVTLILCEPAHAQFGAAAAPQRRSSLLRQMGLAVPSSRAGSVTLLDEVTAARMAAMMASSGSEEEGETENEEESELLEKFQELEFDRRPSAILKAWSTKVKDEDEDDEDKEEDDEESKGSEKQAEQAKDKQEPAKVAAVGPKAKQNKGQSSQAATAATAAPVNKQPVKPLTPEQQAKAALEAAAKQAKAAAEEAQTAAKQAAEEAKKEAKRQAAMQKKLAAFSRDVTLGNWEQVKTFLTTEFSEDNAPKAYQHLLQSLQTHGADVGYRPLSTSSDMAGSLQSSASQSSVMEELNVFSPEDVLAMADACPDKLSDETISKLASFLRRSLGQGHTIESFVKLLDKDQALPECQRVFTKLQAADMIVTSGNGAKAAPFLLSADDAQEANNIQALNLLAKHHLANYAIHKKEKHLENAWRTIQRTLAAKYPEKELPPKENAEENVDQTSPKLAEKIVQNQIPSAPEPDDPKSRAESEKAKLAKAKKAAKEREARFEKHQTEAFHLAIGLAPRVRKELGDSWLRESCSGDPEMGIRILGTIGEKSARAMSNQARFTRGRLRALKLQKTAAEALLATVPDRAEEWKSTLNLLSSCWLKEAELSHRYARSTSMGPSMRRDRYGNIFWYDSEGDSRFSFGGNRDFEAIEVSDLLEVAPNKAWQDLLPPSLKPQFDAVYARLYLKVSESEKAFPYIESLATEYPKQAHGLAEEFLRVWTQNHDPNSDSRRTNQYMYMFGFERRAQGIPLTRSKQERNLKELSQWVKRLRTLPIEPLDEKVLIGAFTTCHSNAEVYRLDALEQVFGSIDGIEPKTLAGLLQQTRANLSGVWRVPAVQKDKKTNRKKKDIQREVLRGYALARALLDHALKQYPDDWSLHLANACLTHDEMNYQQELAVTSNYVQQREHAFALFQKAAEVYAAQVESLEENKQSTEVFDHWFYASLGASDLGSIDARKQPDLKQANLIREAIMALPGKSKEWTHGRFANNLFTRMSAAKPELKFRYLKVGFEIVGDHKQAYEAKKVFDYYNDLVTEIKFATTLDGVDVVGHDEPFGLFVDIVHTREIERESGGFRRYLQNQNNQSYYYNYGRPKENYRDKFEEAARIALQEHFEVLSVTFQTEDVNSRALEKYGWRATPYAYILLKARGPEVDKVPPLRLDLDFIDTSGYAILPIESSPLAIDATPKKTESRPVKNLEVVQTLDERQADQGHLLLEIKAVAQGLVPDLDDILKVDSEGFTVVNTEDQGVSVSRFDPESEGNVVVSERTWTVELHADENLTERPKQFTFGKPVLDLKKVSYQRYADADLMEVKQNVSLEEQYGEPGVAWQGWALAAGLLIVLLIGIAIWALRKKPIVAEQVAFEMPENLTPFTVLGLLKQIEENNGFDSTSRGELATSINRLEEYYFVHHEGADPDLEAIANNWVDRASPIRRPR